MPRSPQFGLTGQRALARFCCFVGGSARTMRCPNALQRCQVRGKDFQRLTKHFESDIERVTRQHSVSGLRKAGRRLGPQPFLQVPFGELDSDVCVLWIKIGALAQYSQRLLPGPGALMRIAYGALLSPP